MIVKNIFLTLSMLLSAQAFGMQTLPQKPIQYSKDLVLELPTDIKSYLLPFVLQGNEREMEKTIVTMAVTSKGFNKMINSPQVMLALLNSVAERSPCRGDAITLAGRLCLKRKVLPVMENPLVTAWVYKTGDSFLNGIHAKPLPMFPVQNENSGIIHRLINYTVNINGNL